ncbi:MAG TPA: tetratricopeptide repeat protein, partial [Desulfuromonadaceae bacterium]|nr:tetratricopeptide repeat protein [Desulfuromonadaceae bacterium]
LVLGAAALSARYKWPKAGVGTAASLILVVLLWLTHEQVGYWRNDVALFSHAVAVTKDNLTAHLNLGYAYQQSGRPDDAMNEYRAVLKLEPDNVRAHNNLANLLDDSGQTDQAIAEFEQALEIDPKYAPAHNNLGTLLVESGRIPEAMQHYSNAMILDPEDWHAPFLLGKALLRQGRDHESLAYFQKALQLSPNSLDVLTYLAQVLASDQDPSVRDGHAAYLLALKANALTGGNQPVMLDRLAMAFAEMGKFDDARQALGDAIDVAKRYGVTNDLAAMEQRLELYNQKQPYRQTFSVAPAKTGK